jgi:hypothetical protein
MGCLEDELFESMFKMSVPMMSVKTAGLVVLLKVVFK